MVLAHAASVAGSYFPETNVNQVRKTNANIARGVVLTRDATNHLFVTAANTATSDRFAVCTKAAVVADAMVEAAVKGPVTVTAGGTINPHQRVMTGNDAKVIAWDGTAAENRIVGVYIGKAEGNERDGTAIAAASDNEVIIIDLNRGVS